MLNAHKECLEPIICYKLVILENWREFKFLFILSEVWKTASEDLSYKSLSLIEHISLGLKNIELITWCSQQIVLVFHTASLAFMRERKSPKTMLNLPRSSSGETALTLLASWEHMGNLDSDCYHWTYNKERKSASVMSSAHTSSFRCTSVHGEICLECSLQQIWQIYCLKQSFKSCMYIEISIIVWSLTAENCLTSCISL